MEYLSCNSDVTHVFIMWTDPNRVEFSTDDQRYLMILGNLGWGSDFDLSDINDRLGDFVPEFYKHFFNEKHNLKRFLLDLHHLQLICQSRGIEFSCACSMQMDLPDRAGQLQKEYQDLIHDRQCSEEIQLRTYVSEVSSFESLLQQTQAVWIDQSHRYGHVSVLEPEHRISESDPHANPAGHRLIAERLGQCLPLAWKNL